MIENTHRVDRTKWAEWSVAQRALFNETYEDIIRVGPELFIHPVTVQRNLSDTEFQTIAWNAAWTAAHCLVGETTFEVHTVYRGETIAIADVAGR